MYTEAFKKITERPDFKTASEETLGVYPQAYGAAAEKANQQAITISPEAKAFVLEWLKAEYDVTME